MNVEQNPLAAEIDLMRDVYMSRAQREAYERILARALEQPEGREAGVDRKRFEQAPCDLCGYNGPGYYQPSQHPCAAIYHNPPAKVPDVVVSRQIITPTCRTNRGGWGAFSEAFDRVRKAYLHYVEAPQNANVEWHLTLTRVEVAAAQQPKEGV